MNLLPETQKLSYYDNDYWDPIKITFAQSLGEDVDIDSVRLEYAISACDVIVETVRSNLEGSRMLSPAAGETLIFNREVILSVSGKTERGRQAQPLSGGGRPARGSRKSKVTVDLFGIAASVKQLAEIIEKHHSSDHSASVTWVYLDDGHTIWREVPLEAPHPVYPEFYPWLEPTCDDYLQAYLKSEAAILLMIGPPGTGKTSLLRYMIWQSKLKAVVSYEEKVLSMDGMFLQFLLGDYDVLVIEDADTMLTSRDHESNKAVSRLLNVSDGLIKFPEKKVVFSTNLEGVKDIDQALVRPGRCHGVVYFRSFTPDEAAAAADAAGLPEPDVGEELTLAQLFNPQTETIKQRKFGFGA